MALSTLPVPQFKTRSREIVRNLYRSRECWRDNNRSLKKQLEDSEKHRQRLVNEKRDLERANIRQSNELARLRRQNQQLRQCPCLPDDPIIANHSFGPKMISMCLELVKVIGYRPVEAVLQIVQQWLGIEFNFPQWTTVRTWSCRCGVGLLNESVTRADDWILMIDHSVQLAKQNVLLVLGVRCSDLPKHRALKREDMSVLAIVPGDSRDKESVTLALDELIEKIGVPMSIVVDGASELHEGVKAFQKQGKTVLVMDDIKHKAANILKHLLGKDAVFKDFESQLGATTARIQQTELAHLLPPKKKSKCRFMTLSPLLRWQRMIQHHLNDPRSVENQGVTPERLNEKLGWVTAFAEPAQQWRQCQAVVSSVLKFSNRSGVYRGATDDLRQQLARLDLAGELVQKVYTKLVEVYQQCEQRLIDSSYSQERLIVSTEVLESTLGGFKRLQKQHTRGGFTSLLAALPTLMSKQMPADVTRLLEKVSNKKWKQWCAASNLANSTHAKKLAAYKAATKNTDKTTLQLE